jgi:cation diffusion facilitator CzcD-associated flavoprotein CzcO
MAIQLRRAGLDDFTLLEAERDIGGTWRDNHYPGAACDVQSNVYSYSFEPNPDWSRTFASQPEILAYTLRCAEKYDLSPYIQRNARVVHARWDASRACWTVTTADGRVFEGRVLVSATGPLSRPAWPGDVQGIEDFPGVQFHSARWDHGRSLDGLRVAVVGTGASAIQIVPELQKRAARVYVFQRTPPWVLPKPDRPVAPRTRALYAHFPWLQRADRALHYARAELLGVPLMHGNRPLRHLVEWACKRHIARSVHDPVLRAKLLPRYHPGCKRILLSNDWYTALAQPHVELLTEGLQRIEGTCVIGAAGTRRHVDAIVWCTGFQVGRTMVPFEVQGVRGTLGDAWRHRGPEAYLGTSVHGFPNFFLIVGPNTGLGHNSILFMIECQVRYVLDAILTMRRERWASVDVRESVQEAYVAELDRRSVDTVWLSGGCTSYYIDGGRNFSLWPGYTFEFAWRTRRFDPDGYTILRETCVAPSAHAVPGSVVR